MEKYNKPSLLKNIVNKPNKLNMDFVCEVCQESYKVLLNKNLEIKDVLIFNHETNHTKISEGFFRGYRYEYQDVYDYADRYNAVCPNCGKQKTILFVLQKGKQARFDDYDYDAD